MQVSACGGKKYIPSDNQSRGKGLVRKSTASKTPDPTPQRPAASTGSTGSSQAAGTGGQAALTPRRPQPELRVFHEVQARSGSVHINMGDTEIDMPVPSGYNALGSGDERRQQVNAWFIPNQNVYAVYEPVNYSRGRSRSVKNPGLFESPLLIFSARPEMTDNKMPAGVFDIIKRDLQRDNGNYDQGKWDEFMRYTASRYKDSERLDQKLGITGLGRTTISLGYIIKEAAPGPSAVPIQASHKTLVPPSVPPASTALSNAEFNVSMQNLIFIDGHCFNVYYNVRLRDRDDLTEALKENSRIMRELQAQL